MRRYYNNFLRYQFFFLVIWLIITGLTIVFLRPTSTYNAEATLWAQEPLSLTQYNNLISEGYQSAATNLQSDWSQLIHTANFRGQVIGLVKKDGFKLSSTSQDALDANIDKNFIIQALGDHVIQVKYSDITSDLTLEVTNDVIQVYIAQISGQLKNQNESAIQVLQAKVDDAKKKLDQSNTQLQQFGLSHPDVVAQNQSSNSDLNESTSSATGLDYKVLQQNTTNATNDYNTLESQLEQMQIDYQSFVDGRSSILRVTDNPLIASYTDYTPTAKIIYAVIFGTVATALFVTICVWLFTWSEFTFREKEYAKEMLGVKLLLELPINPLLVTGSADSSGPKEARLGPSAQSFRRTRYVLNSFLLFLIFAFAGLIGFGNGKDPLLTIVLIIVTMLLLGIYRWPVAGLLLVVFIVLFCETSLVPDGISQYTTLPLTNMNFYTSIPLSATPVEVTLAYISIVCLIRKGFSRKKFFDNHLISWSMLIFTGFIFFGFIYGVIIKKGDFKTAEWEIRAILYVPILYFLTLRLMRSKKVWQTFSWIFPIAISIQICISIERFFVLLVPTNPDLSTYEDSLNGFNHETALISVILVGWCLGKLILGGSLGEKFLSILLICPAIVSIIISNRRSAFATLAGVIVIFFAILYTKKPKLTIVIVLISAISLFSFTKAFSNSDGILGQLANSFSLSGAKEGTRDYASNLYRIVEKNNVILTIKQSPLTGVGFGQPFTQFIHFIVLDGFVFQFYTPHIQILWLWLKVGAIGWGTFWFIICNTLFRLGLLIKHERDKSIYTVCTLVGSIIYVILIYAYVDLSLVNTRFMTLLGVSIGLIEIAYRNLPNRESKFTTVVKKKIRTLVKPSNALEEKEKELVVAR